MLELPSKLKLTYNPFEPAATGAPLSGAPLFVPQTIRQRAANVITTLQSGSGVKAVVAVGPYGSGKTCLLQWLNAEVFPARHIKSFYFDNPGVQFYDLANRLLRTIGRKDFAKFIWELAGSHVATSYQRTLFHSGFEQYLHSWATSRKQPNITKPLQDAIIAAGITGDEQIAHCLARIVTEVVKQPYFEYRDFVPRQKGSVVPEGEEAPYFRSILKTIEAGMNARGTAFVVDEFEEIGLQKRLSRRAAHDYLATLKRLVNLTHAEGVEFWLVLSMTPDAYDTTKRLDPALVGRMEGNMLEIEPLTWPDARSLMTSRLAAARLPGVRAATPQLYPFPEEPAFRPTTYNNPRRLVKVCFRAIAKASDGIQVPFEDSYLRTIENDLYPRPNSDSH